LTLNGFAGLEVVSSKYSRIRGALGHLYKGISNAIMAGLHFWDRATKWAKLNRWLFKEVWSLGRCVVEEDVL